MPQKLENIISYFKSTKNKFISVELCPNRDLDLQKLAQLRPPFCSITWLDNNLRNVQTHPSFTLTKKLQKNGFNVLLHLPGRIFTKETAGNILNLVQEENVSGIFALQGEYALIRDLDVVPTDFKYAVDLIKFTKQNFGETFSIAVTGYPDGHPRAESWNIDMQHLKEKVDSGANFIISQSIFDMETFRRFYLKCKELGITVPILPGIYIINSFESLMHMKKFCKLSIPEDIMKFIQENSNINEVIREYGVRKAAEIIESLFNSEETPIVGVHIFTLNDFDLVEDVFKSLKFSNVVPK